MRLEQLHRADEGREDAAAIDVPHEDDRRVGDPGHEHVHEIAVLEVDLGGAARPLDDHQVARSTKPVERLADDLAELGFVRVVVHGAEAPDRLAEDDDLRPRVALGLEQNRVHVDGGHHARGLRLHGLGAPDLEAVGSDGRIEGHVLRLEGSDAEAFLPKEAAEGGGHDALAHRRRGSLDHQRASDHGWSSLRRA